MKNKSNNIAPTNIRTNYVFSKNSQVFIKTEMLNRENITHGDQWLPINFQWKAS